MHSQPAPHPGITAGPEPEDNLLEALCRMQIIKKQETQHRMASLPIPPDSPAALLWTLVNHPHMGRPAPRQLLSILAEELALREAREKRPLGYIPCPGYNDARLILTLDKYDTLPRPRQREFAFLLRTPDDRQALLVLDTDPWRPESTGAAFACWKTKAIENGLEIEPDILHVHGFTHLHEALSCDRHKHWEPLAVKPLTQKTLEASRLNPYWETPTHIYAWDASHLPAEETRRLHARLESLLFKKIRLTPQLFKHLGDPSGKYLAPPAFSHETRKIWEDFLKTAILESHSDIHIQPNIDGAVAVASRRFGKVRPRLMIPVSQRDNFYKTVMLGTGLDALKDAHVPRDARASFSDPLLGRTVDLRYSLHPGPPPRFWPQVIIRLLDPDNLKPDIFALASLFPEDRAAWDAILRLNDGMVLVAGPTGSGKSMTLYTLLHSWHLKDPGLKFQTIEDPIEFLLGPWLHQSEVLHDRHVSWHRLIRQSLRNDIDGLMLGEIRDRETAELANQFSLSGHLLLSTLHAASACLIASRLKEMGADTATTAHTLKAAIAQKLAAFSCPHCQRPLTREEQTACLVRGAPGDLLGELIDNTGCSACNHEGVNGRTALQEFAFFQNAGDVRFIRDPDPHGLRKRMQEQGFASLGQKAWKLACKRIIPASEALDIAETQTEE
ncbi:ATPase, T2SS/T4P/T4SS family [Termitidicoccus mucosus]|uniref:Bacterial type II secretion system protein E domain-containing protein n=1 Tax=Termitidicoccus mucosus TaxID=1184151 RepID=A0A178IPD1_9BACT|nr:hypothetical protein AW736_02250 [Opitutaceae bacterium TSB47]